MGHRRHADAQLDAVALPLPAGGVPLPAAARRERPTRPRRARVRARRHRHPRRRPVLRRRRSRYAKAAPDDLCITIAATNHGPDAGAARTCCRSCGCATPGRGAGTTAEAPLHRAAPAGRCRSAGSRPSSATTASSGTTSSPPRALPDGALLRQRDERRRAVRRRGEPHRRTPRTAIDRPGRARRHARRSTRRTPAPRSRSGTDFDAVAPGETVAVRLRLSQAAPNIDTFGPGFDAVVGDRAARGRRVLRPRHRPRRCPTRTGTSPAGRTPACCGASSSTATTSTSGSTGDPAEPPPPSPDGAHPAPATRHWTHLSLADVISMPDEWEYPWFAAWDLAFHAVAAGPRRPGVRQGAAGADVPGMGDAPERPTARLRVGVRRRQPAGARLGGLARLPHRRLPGPRLPRSGCSPSCCSTSPGGSTARTPTGPTCSRAASSGWTTSACSTGRRRCRPATGWSSPTRPAGWRSTASRCSRSRWSCPGTTRPGTTSPPSSSSTSCPSPQAMNTFGSQDMSLWHEDDGFFYDVLVSPDGEAQHDAGALDGRAAADARRDRDAVAGSPSDVPRRRPRRLRWLQRRRPELVAPADRRHPAGRRRTAAVAARPGAAAADPASGCSTPSEFLSPYGIRSLSAAYRGGVTVEVGGQRACRSSTSPGSRAPACSAATRTGAGRSGSRSTCCSPTSCAPTAGTSATRSPSRSRPARATSCTLEQAADIIDDGLTALFRPVDGERPADGERIEASPTTRCGASTRRSASTSTATPARASARRTRPAGPRWSPTCSTRGCPGSHAATADDRPLAVPSPTIVGMEQDPLVWIAALRSGHDRLAEFVAGASADDLARRSMATEWSVAQVLSHLGSGAEIGLAGRTGEAIENEAVWARWNAKRPDDMASSFVEADEALVSWWESQTPEELAVMQVQLPFLPAPIDAAGSHRLPVVGGGAPRLGRAGDVRRRRHPRPRRRRAPGRPPADDGRVHRTVHATRDPARRRHDDRHHDERAGARLRARARRARRPAAGDRRSHGRRPRPAGRGAAAPHRGAARRPAARTVRS